MDRGIRICNIGQLFSLVISFSFLNIYYVWQDIFADLRPNMSRYSSIEEVNAALAELEEHEGKVSGERHPEIEKRSNNISRSNLGNGQRLANGVDENGGAHEDTTRDSESDSGSGSIGDGGHDDDDDMDDENHDPGSESEDDDDDEVGPASDEDGEFRARKKASALDPMEEAEFDREFKALMQESLDSRKLELRSRPTLDMMIPMSILEGSSKDHHGRGLEGESGEETLDEENGGNREVRVKVLVKRGHKQQTKQMFIPQDCSLVRSTKQKEAAELEEKQDIKRLVLEYNDREEEELSGVGNQIMGWTQSGIGRIPSRGSAWDGSGGRGSGARHRYHHHPGGGHYYSRRR